MHCIVPGGGINISGKWKEVTGNGKYLFPVKAMSRVFRARFIASLRKLIEQPIGFYDALFTKYWVVYCKAPFYNNSQVVEYLGRYTHKIAISNHRLINIADKKVSFRAKDYRKAGASYILSLSDGEFIRRFCMHILPKGFTRIRHYGILSSCKKKIILPQLQLQLANDTSEKLKEAAQSQHRRCTICKKGALVTLCTFGARGPPQQWINTIKQQHKTSQTTNAK